MEYKTFSFKSGKVEIEEFTKEGFDNGQLVPGVIYDIYYHLPDFRENIYWINKAKVNDGYTLEDLLDEFTIAEGNDKFIVCKAGELLNDISSYGKIDKLIEKFESELGYILNAFFYNIIFNRKMSNSCYSNYYCIYSNEKTDKFINDNIGPADSDKIINRTTSSGKL